MRGAGVAGDRDHLAGREIGVAVEGDGERERVADFEIAEGLAAEALDHGERSGEPSVGRVADRQVLRPYAEDDGAGNARALGDHAQAAGQRRKGGAVGAAGELAGQRVHRGASDEAGDEQGRGTPVEVERRADLLHPAAVHHHDAVGQRHRLHLVMGDVDRRRPHAAVELADLEAHLDAQRGVEVRERLVEEEGVGGPDDGAAHGDALALAAGELGRLPLQQVVELQHRGGGADLLRDLGLGMVAHLQAEAHVLGHAHVRIKRIVLENHGDVALGRGEVTDLPRADGDVAASDLLQPRDHPQERRFPATGRADEDEELAALHGEVDAGNDRHLAIGLADALKLDVCHFRPSLSTRALDSP